jgi:hypothetical protein
MKIEPNFGLYLNKLLMKLKAINYDVEHLEFDERNSPYTEGSGRYIEKNNLYSSKIEDLITDIKYDIEHPDDIVLEQYETMKKELELKYGV